MKTTKKIESLKDFFITKTFNKGEDNEFRREIMNDKNPFYEELKQAVYNSKMEIQDFDYNQYAIAFDDIYNDIKNNISNLDDIDGVIETIENFEINDESDCYTKDLTEWLNSDINNVYYLSEAISEFEAKDGFEVLSIAQSIAIREKQEGAKQAIIEFLQD